MRAKLLCLASVLALSSWSLSAPALAQATGPDASMAAQRAEPGRRAASTPPAVAGHETPRAENLHPDSECDKLAGEAGAEHGDVRAARAGCRALSDSDIALAPIVEVKSVTHHTAEVGGRTIPYTATAGTLTLRDDEGKPTASMFYVAYTAGEGRGSPRPVTFFYNGGPGSSTLWLHMGSLSPVRVATDSPQATHNAPYDLVNNNDSLLDKSDLVFLDAVGAGYSRPVGDTKLSAFWGTDQDIDAFARGIERYLTINDRWNSPKFIFGESYGTTRSAGLSYRLQEDGVQLNGVILLSSILNYGRRDPGFDQEVINYVPSFAAAAAYHNRLNPAPADIPAFLREVRQWAHGPYAEALAEGQNLDPATRTAIAQKLSGYIGLPADYILQSNLRVSASRFRKELLRDQRLTLGRYDDRFTGM
ncbi:MAG TPA: hypothetical protein VGG68_09120, partial [Caulobacteraceae bacterium]